MGELIRSMLFSMFNKLPNAPLDCPLLEALVHYYDSAKTSFSISRRNVQFITRGISYITSFLIGKTLMEVDLKVEMTRNRLSELLDVRATIGRATVEKMMKEMVAAVDIDLKILANMWVFYIMSSIMFPNMTLNLNTRWTM